MPVGTSPFTLAASAEMLHLDLPMEERIRRLHDDGFAVEIWDWSAHDLDLLERLVADGIRLESMTGYLAGDLTTADGADELVRTAAESVAVGRRLGIARLNLHGTGLGQGGLPVHPVTGVTPAMWLAARHTLGRIAELGEREGATFMLENLNLRVDHPGTPFATVADCLALVESVDSRALTLNLDLYHCQVDEGNLIETCRRSLPHIGEIQVADVPGRCEPGTGEISYAGVARALSDMGYSGVVALEGFASGSTEDALDAFRTAFTLA